jgi:hypothetical protein
MKKIIIDGKVLANGKKSIIGMDKPIELYTKEGIDEKVANITDAKLNVFKNLVAEGIDETTTAILEYGVNVFTTATLTDYCAKLPQPITGKSTKIVNMTGQILILYPSNIGGRINNLAVDTPAIIPPNGVSYEFTCIENPLPGAWTWIPPATGQYDTGEMVGNITLGYNAVLIGIPSTGGSLEWPNFLGETPWAHNVQFQPADIGTAFRPDLVNWNAITRIKVYTNLSKAGAYPSFQIMSAAGYSYYDAITNAFVSNPTTAAGSYSSYGNCNLEVIGGSLPVGTLTANAGDAGTAYGFLDVPAGGFSYIWGHKSKVGVSYEGLVSNGTLASWFGQYISLQINPGVNLTGFKFRFIIEYV